MWLKWFRISFVLRSIITDQNNSNKEIPNILQFEWTYGRILCVFANVALLGNTKYMKSRRRNDILNEINLYIFFNKLSKIIISINNL